EAARDDADHAAAGGERRIGEGSHQPTPATAVDELDPEAREPLPGDARRGRVTGVRATVRPAEHADRAEDRHAGPPQNPSSRRIGVIRRAARPRCETAPFSSADHRPNVRPPGGSPAGSKIGSYPKPPVPRGARAMRPRVVPRTVRIGTAARGPAPLRGTA